MRLTCDQSIKRRELNAARDCVDGSELAPGTKMIANENPWRLDRDSAEVDD